MLIARHRVAVPAFTLLAHGRANTEVVGLLRVGQLSKQMLLIRAVRDAAGSFPRAAATARLNDAVQVIDAAQRRDPASAAEVLGYPLVGAWAAHCLRRLRRPVENATPLWVDLGHLASIAAATAIRTRLDLALPVPVRSGAAPLPTLGRARLEGDAGWGVATVRGGGGSYTVEGLRDAVAMPPGPYEESLAWDPVHRLVLTEAGRTLTVFLDDLDPYRSHGMRPAGRLDTGAGAAWRHQLVAAWRLLVRHHPERAAELAAAPITAVPLAAVAGAPQVSGTTRDTPWAMALTPQPDPFLLAMSMVHELQHSKLGALLDLVQLYDHADRRAGYSPWRADPRPVGGLLQGAYAFLAVGAFWGRHAVRATGEVPPAVAGYEFARTIGQVRTAIRDLVAGGSLTGPGLQFVAGMREAAEGLAGRADSDRAVARLARLVLDDHRISWRLRNLVVDESLLDTVAEAWRRSQPCPAHRPPALPAAGGPPRHVGQPRHEQATQMTGNPSATSCSGPDAALLRGDYPAAARSYLDGIRVEPRREELWAGLAVARLRTGPPDLARAYETEPELVAALYARLAAGSGATADPDAIARWLR